METNTRFKMAAAMVAQACLEKSAKEMDTAQLIVNESIPEMTQRLEAIRCLIEDFKEDLQERFVDSVE